MFTNEYFYRYKEHAQIKCGKKIKVEKMNTLVYSKLLCSQVPLIPREIDAEI